MKEMTEEERATALAALEQAISVAGTQQKLADALGLRSPSITEWKERGVPLKRCKRIEQLTGVPRSKLRPDIFGPALAEPVAA